MGAVRVEPTGDPQGPHKEGSLCVSVLAVPSPRPPHPQHVSDLGLRGRVSSSPRLQDFSSQRHTVLRWLVSCRAAAHAARCSHEARGHRAAHRGRVRELSE